MVQKLIRLIENLNNARGLIDCPEAFQLALKLKDENAEFSQMCIRDSSEGELKNLNIMMMKDMKIKYNLFFESAIVS